jgi:hypothetical protein
LSAVTSTAQRVVNGCFPGEAARVAASATRSKEKIETIVPSRMSTSQEEKTAAQQ